MPEPLSQHHFPRLWLRRVVTWALAVAIAFMSVALIVQIILAFILRSYFFRRGNFHRDPAAPAVDANGAAS